MSGFSVFTVSLTEEKKRERGASEAHVTFVTGVNETAHKCMNLDIALLHFRSSGLALPL